MITIAGGIILAIGGIFLLMAVVCLIATACQGVAEEWRRALKADCSHHVPLKGFDPNERRTF